MIAQPRDQEIQAVLYVGGYDLGKYGVDGKIGKVTENAMAQYAKDHGLEGMDTKAIGDEILKRMKDPEFRQDALNKLAEMPENKNTVVAQQWMLHRSGHDDLHMRDLVTRLMTGDKNEQTQYALTNTEKGIVSDQVMAKAGLSMDTILAVKDEMLSPKSSETELAAKPRPLELANNM